MKNFIYAETAFHHEGDLDYMIKLIDLTRSCGAQGIKFQLLSHADQLISIKHSAYSALSELTFTMEEWDKIMAHAIKQDLELVIMPLDTNCFTLIEKYSGHIHMLELHSVSFNDWDLLEKMKKSSLPVMLGVGGRTLEEIDALMRYLGHQLKVLMVGFQAFPSKIEDVKLGRISYLKQRYPHLYLGYADHSKFDDPLGVKSFEYAYLLGATYFEKHITLHEGIKRTDFDSATGKDKFIKIIQNLSNLQGIISIDQDMNESIMDMEDSEKTYRNRQKIAVATCNIEKGEKLSKKNVTLRMLDKTNGVADINLLLEKTTNKPIMRHDIISLNDIDQ